MIYLTTIVKRILIANAIIYFIFQNIPGFVELTILTPSGILEQFKIYQLISYQYLHGSFLHIFFNMLILVYFAPTLENQWGSKNFLVFYTVAGAFAGFAQILFSSPNSAILGASGSVMGVFCAYALYYPNREIMLLFFPVPIKIKYIFMVYVIIDVMNAFTGKIPNIANIAHLGGALVGFIFVKYFDKSYSTSSWSDGSSYSSGSGSMNTFFDKMKSTFEQKQSSQSRKTFSDSDDYSKDKIHFYRTEMDRLLDKINEVGYLKLTDDERKRLEDASNYIKKYDSH